MLKIVLKYIIIALFVLLCISKLFDNPFKLILILGKKGSGKSMYCIKQMIRYKKRGWTIYTDIPDCKIKGVREINAKDLEHFTPVTHSAVFLDEAGLTFDNRKFKEFASGLNEWFKLQRKYKCVVYVNSQGMDIDLKLRLLLDKLILMTPVMNMFTIARPIKRNVTLTDPYGDAESRVADKLQFQSIFTWRLIYMPRYFRYFDSYSAPSRPEIPFREITKGYKIRLKPLPYLKYVALPSLSNRLSKHHNGKRISSR